jgi:hypothetical protein
MTAIKMGRLRRAVSQESAAAVETAPVPRAGPVQVAALEVQAVMVAALPEQRAPLVVVPAAWPVRPVRPVRRPVQRVKAQEAEEAPPNTTVGARSARVAITPSHHCMTSSQRPIASLQRACSVPGSTQPACTHSEQPL